MSKSAEFAAIMHSAEISTLTQANVKSGQSFSAEVVTAVTMYAYGYADGSLLVTSVRVMRALYDLLERKAKQTSEPIDTHDVIRACGEFLTMRDAVKESKISRQM